MQKYNHDKVFFDVPNVVNSYWAGFLAADGNIYRNPKRISSCRLNCSLKDEEHLIKFKKALNANNPIRKYDKKVKDSIYSYYHLNIDNSEYLCSSLFNVFGIGENKSLSLLPPSLKDEAFIRAFIRGYFDGDGSIYLNKSGGFQVSFLGTVEIIDWIKSNFQYYIDSRISGCIDQVKSITRFRLTGRSLPESVMNWLYLDSDKYIRLDRKYSRFLEYSFKVADMPQTT